MVLAGLLKLTNSSLQFAAPVLLNLLLSFMEDREKKPGVDTWKGYMWMGLLTLALVIKALIENQVRLPMTTVVAIAPHASPALPGAASTSGSSSARATACARR